MATTHLTDEQIQDYLDGNLTHYQVTFLTEHIQSCQKCQAELAQYQSLYGELKEDVPFNLSPNFSNAVMKAVQAEQKKAFWARVWNMLLPIIGIAVGIGVMMYYVDFKPFVKIFADSLNPARYFDDSEVLSELSQVLAKLNLNLNIIVFAGLSLLIVILIDYLISRHREKLFSYLRMLPVLYIL